jgi:hypothetical protein
MLGLESSVKWRGTDKVRATSLALPPVYARCLPEDAVTTGRIAVTLGSACRAQARRAASGAEPVTNRGPVRARHDHGGPQLAAWPARLRAVVLRFAPPRRGLLEERARSPGQPARPGGSARTLRACRSTTLPLWSPGSGLGNQRTRGAVSQEHSS